MVYAIRVFHTILSLSYFVNAIPFEFEQMHDNDNPCTKTKEDIPVYCKPEFINPISTYKLPIKVGESCAKNCKRGGGEKRRSFRCSCRKHNSINRHSINSPKFLTDIHNTKNVTCWKSNTLPAVENNTGFYKNITLTLSLKKRYQLYYFSIRFCTKPPENMVIYKSVDNKRTWIPYHYYSTNCRSAFNVIPGLQTDRPGVAPCIERNNMVPLPKDGLIVNIGPNNSGKDMGDLTREEHDWASVSDIKIDILNPYYTRNQQHMISSSKEYPRSGKQKHNLVERNSAVYYGISDISMGGMCQCNGHASVCKIVRGRPQCECEHHTAGVDCDQCESFYFDRPWQRATKSSANACVACECNLHAKKCTFDMGLYKLSGNVSGGVCLRCRHNTVGRFCHQCKKGYYRNPSRSIFNRRACIPCQCHPVGSALEYCNRTTGQCPCKDHATGLRCQKCAPGYQQTNSLVAPCIKKVSEKPTLPYQPISTGVCTKKCELSVRKQMKKKKFCRKDLVFEVLVLWGSEEGDWYKYKVDVAHVYKKSNGKSLRRGGHTYLRTRKTNIHPCNCSKLALTDGRKYLIYASYSQPIILDPSDSIVPWRDHFRQKLKRTSSRHRRQNIC